MLRTFGLGILIVIFSATLVAAQSREEKVRNDKKKVEAEGFWIYGDLPRGLDEARQSNKPLVVILRCLPCEECVKLDDELIDGDARVKPLLEQFVRVRIISTNGLDLTQFQFDTDQSFAVFMLNADGTIYGRFGTRSDRTEWIGDVSIDGLAKALTKALELHRSYPSNRAALAAKRGPAPEFTSPEKIPVLSSKYKSTIDYSGNVVQSCIHCHQIGDAIRELTFQRKQKLPDTVLYPFPHPKSVGLILDPKELATVERVVEKSWAEQAGFKAGDAIETLAGQPLISIADVQWVLHNVSPAGGSATAEVLRGGKREQLTLTLPEGWRAKGDISWRASTWQLRRRALGGMFLKPADDDLRDRLKITTGSMALLVKHVGQYPPHNIAQRAGMKADDVVVGVDDRTDFLREDDLIAYSLKQKQPREKLSLQVLRGGKPMSVTIELPE